MLRRRIRKTETAWRKLCRFLCFSAPIHWGTRVASAIRPVRAAVFFAEPQQGDSPSADGGNVAAPAAGAMPYPRRGAKRKDNLRFSFLFELLPFLCFLIWRRFPICDRFEKGNGSRVTAAYLSPPFRSSQIAYCYTNGFVCAGTTQGELPKGQERVPWGISVSRNPLARYNARHLRI